jgi:phosphoenolpyruvate carboxykinase (ATP)
MQISEVLERGRVAGRHNLSAAALVERALLQKEGVLSQTGALSVETGARTGRSPLDRYIVSEAVSKSFIDWGKVNQPLSEACFNALWERVLTYLSERDVLSGNYRVGAHYQHGVDVTVVTELAWHQLFARNLFIRNEKQTIESEMKNAWVLLQAPYFLADPARDGVHAVCG